MSVWIDPKEKLPEENKPVNIVYVNRNPPSYYREVKDKPFVATGVYFRGSWYWWSSCVENYLAEYGRDDADELDDFIEVIAWMPLPKYPDEEEQT